MPHVPAVTVVIPTKDRWPLLQRALASALGQVGVDLEVVVVVDGGTDETQQQLERLDDPRVRVVVHPTSTGVAVARNDGAAGARGRWLSFLDDDDFWAPDRTRRMVAAGDAAGAVLVTAGTVHVEEDGAIDQIVPSLPDDIRWRLRQSNSLGGPSCVLVRRDAFETAGGFDPSYEVLADWELWLRIAERGDAAGVPDVLNAYVVHDGAMHVQQLDRARAEYRAMVAGHRSADLPFDEERWWRWIGDTHKSAGRRWPAVRTYAGVYRRYRNRTELPRIASALAGRRLAVRARARLRAGDVASVPWLDAFTNRSPE